MEASRHRLGALSKGILGGGGLSKREQNRKTVSYTQKDQESVQDTGKDALSEKVWRMAAGGHSHTVSATSLCRSVELQFAFVHPEFCF